MSQFNSKTKTNHRTFEGGKAYARTPKQELFVSAISNFVDTNNFYESQDEMVTRITELARKVVKSDPEWMYNFVYWLRNKANLRSVSILIGVEAAVSTTSSEFTGRKILSGAMARADEPGEVLAYWKNTRGNMKLPAAIKRAVADGARRLYNQYSVNKYDSSSREFRFGDVINLTHPKPESAEQEQLFKYILDRRYGNKTLTGSSLLSLQRNREAFLSLSDEEKIDIIKSDDGHKVLSEAGLTWENILSGVKGDKEVLWSALIPTMGYMALLRNLRNFEEHIKDPEVWRTIYDRISDKSEVEKSRQLPFRFLSAYKSVSKSHHKLREALERAVAYSLDNITDLPGNSLIFLDLSGSMFWSWMSRLSSVTMAEAGSLFAFSLAKKSDKALLVGFGSHNEILDVPRSFEGILEHTLKMRGMGGTLFSDAIEEHYTPGTYDRVIVITDEQFGSYHFNDSNPYATVESNVPVYVWNLVGYRLGSVSGQSNVHQLGGLSSESFNLIPLIEAGEKGDYPWNV